MIFVEPAQTHANLMCSIACSSGSTHFCHLGEPYVMVPKMILETLSPDFPRRTARVSHEPKLSQVAYRRALFS